MQTRTLWPFRIRIEHPCRIAIWWWRCIAVVLWVTVTQYFAIPLDRRAERRAFDERAGGKGARGRCRARELRPLDPRADREGLEETAALARAKGVRAEVILD